MQEREFKKPYDKPSPEDIKKRRTGPKIRYHDEGHVKNRESARRSYHRKKEAKKHGKEETGDPD